MGKRLMVCFLAFGLGFGAFSCADDGSSSNNEGADSIKLVFPSNKAMTMRINSEDSIIVSYKDKDGDGVSGKSFTALSADAACADVVAQVSTGAKGNASLAVSAKTAACSTKITITSDNSKLEPIVVDITVNETGNVGGKGSIVVVDPAVGNLKLETSNSKKVIVQYNDGSNVAVANADLALSSDDAACASLSVKTVSTNNEGKATFTVTGGSAACAATITVAVSGLEEVKASIPVTVGRPKSYNATANLIYNGSRAPVIAEMKVVLLYETECTKFRNNPDSSVFNFQAEKEVTVLGYSLTTNHTATVNNVDTAKASATLVAIGRSGGTIIAYGCADGYTIDNPSQDLEIFTYSPKLVGTYTLISNFDYISGFQQTPGQRPKLESMLAGDWAQFIVDLVGNPVNVLIDFIYVNAIVRLTDLADWDVLKQLNNEATRKLIVNLATNALESNYLKDYDWYVILKAIGPDVQDLANNMQFKGEFKIVSEPGDGGVLLKEQKHEYSALSYRWSLDQDMKPLANCLPDYKSCRRDMSLQNAGSEAMSGLWAGGVSEESGESVLNIASHGMTFKWATILYNAVFGEILPRALEYTPAKDSSGKRILLYSFLNSILFKSVVEGWNTKNPTDKVEIIGTDYCAPFIIALLKMVANSGDSGVQWLKDFITNQSGIIKTLGETACDAGFKALEKTLTDQLNKFEVKTANGVQFAASNCPLSVTNLEYSAMGTPDDPAVTAGQVFGTTQASTNRCIWNVTFPINGNNVTLKGLFHAERK